MLGGKRGREHLFHSKVALPDIHHSLEDMFKNQVLNFEGPHADYLKRIVTFSQLSHEDFWTMTFKPILSSPDIQPDKRISIIHAMPDLDHADTKLFWSFFGYTNPLSYRYHLEGPTILINNKQKFDPDNIYIETNLVNYQPMHLNEDKSRRLLRKVRRTSSGVNHMEFENVVWLPVATDKITEIEIKMTSGDGSRAHIYDKCQLVLELRKLRQD